MDGVEASLATRDVSGHDAENVAEGAADIAGARFAAEADEAAEAAVDRVLVLVVGVYASVVKYANMTFLKIQAATKRNFLIIFADWWGRFFAGIIAAEFD